MVYQSFFVFSDSSIEFVYQTINRGIHIFLNGIGVNRVAIHIDGSLRLMPELFDCKDAVYVRYKIKMPFYFFDFALYISAQRIGYFDVMA